MIERQGTLPERVFLRMEAFGAHFLRVMESLRPEVVHEKAHAYPISEPELWDDTDESIIEWEVPRDKPMRLYIHVPWCKSRCVFCFYESTAGEPAYHEVEKYLDCLKRELTIYCARLGVERLNAETLYIGGGTPSVLTPAQIESLLQIVHHRVNFVENAFLITESSPGTLSPEKVQAFVDGGVNRISIGVQSLQDHILSICGRDHDSAQVVRAYEMVRAAGVPEINFDLMLALPEQSLADFEATVRTAMDLAPSSLSFLDLRVAPGSELHKQGHYYPTWREDISMRAIYQQLLREDGRYERTRPHYYVRPEEARGRSTRVPCFDSRTGPGLQIGLGVTAYSHVGDVVYLNACNPSYATMVQQGQLPVQRGFVLSEQDKTAMRAIRAIVDHTLVPDAPAVLAQYADEIRFLRQHGLIDDQHCLTDDGCLFGEEVVYMFYPRTDEEKSSKHGSFCRLA